MFYFYLSFILLGFFLGISSMHIGSRHRPIIQFFGFPSDMQWLNELTHKALKRWCPRINNLIKGPSLYSKLRFQNGNAMFNMHAFWIRKVDLLQKQSTSLVFWSRIFLAANILNHVCLCISLFMKNPFIVDNSRNKIFAKQKKPHRFTIS